MNDGVMFNLIAAILLAVILKPPKTLEDNKKWGRYGAALAAFVSAISTRPHVSSWLDYLAAWAICVIFATIVGLIVGRLLYRLFAGAKQVVKVAPAMAATVSEHTEGIRSQIKKSVGIADLSDTDLYSVVADELKSNRIDDGLWTKAFALEGGEENATKARYIKLRVLQLKTARQEG